MKSLLLVSAVFCACGAFAAGGFWKAMNAIQKTVDVANAVNDVANRTQSQPAQAAPTSAPSVAPAPTPPPAAASVPASAAPAPTSAASVSAPAAPAVDAAPFAAMRTTATETAVPNVQYGMIYVTKPATPEQIAEAKKAYLNDGRQLEDARLKFEKVDDATVGATIAAFRDATSVEMKETKIESLAPFALLGNVRRISLNKVTCADTSPFAHCAKLQALELRYCTLSDFSGFAALQNLETIDLYGSNVSGSFAPLASCSRLKKIDYYAVKGDQALYDSLGTLKQVKEFHGGLTKMTSIKWLLNVPQAEVLVVFSEKIDDLSPISTLANLTHFKGWNMDGGRMAPALGDLSFLVNCKKLKKLELPGSSYTGTALIGTFADIEELDLSRAKQPVDVSFVKQLPKLKRISLYGTEVLNGGAIPSGVKVYKDKKTKGL